MLRLIFTSLQLPTTQNAPVLLPPGVWVTVVLLGFLAVCLFFLLTVCVCVRLCDLAWPLCVGELLEVLCEDAVVVSRLVVCVIVLVLEGSVAVISVCVVVVVSSGCVGVCKVLTGV